MSHISNRVGPPPIECPLASLGRNTPSIQTHQVTYQHPLSTSPLDPQVYQMSRQSPLLNDHLMYTTENVRPTNTSNDATTTTTTNNPPIYPSTSSVGLPTSTKIINNNNNSSSSKPLSHSYNNRPPPLRNYTPIEAILAYHDRLSPVHEQQQRTNTTTPTTTTTTTKIPNVFNRSIPHGHQQRVSQLQDQRNNQNHHKNDHQHDIDDNDDDDDDDVDGNLVSHTRSKNSNNPLIVNHHGSYYMSDKIDLYQRNVPTTSERYYLEDQMDNLTTSFNSSHQHHDSSSPSRFLCRASSPSETSGSDRYHSTSRPSRDSPAMIHSHYNNNNQSHSTSSTSGGGGGYGDSHSSLARFSPSLDQGYATLVSPSPSSGGGPQTPSPWNRTNNNHLRSGPMFDRLSDEMVLQVLHWLDSCDLGLISRVCRRFEMLAWRPVLWKHIALRGEHIVGDKALKAIFRRLCGQTRNGTCAEVEKVMLHDGCRMTDKGLQLVSRRCPELTHLQVQYCTITNNALFDLVTRCSNLQHLDITGCSQITTINFVSGFDPPRRLLLQFLDLTDCCAIGDDGLKIIVRNCPQLLYLYLRRCLQISDAGLRFVPSFCVTLRELSVSDCGGITDFGLYELAKLGSTLRYLSVAKCDQVSDAGLKVIARRCYKLRYLNARGCEAVSDDSIIVLAGSCPRLRALDIGKCDVSDAGLRALAESCPNLKKLSLKNCDMITDRGIQCVAYYCRGLQQLNIQDCQISLEGYRAVKRFCKRCVIEHTNPGFY